MAKEVEALEDHAHLHADAIDVLVLAVEVVAVDDNGPGINGFQPVDGAQQGGFPRSGGPQNDHFFAGLDVEADIGKRLEGAEELVNAVQTDDRISGVHNGSTCVP